MRQEQEIILVCQPKKERKNTEGARSET